MKYIIGIIVGVALTFFIIDYVKVKEKLEYIDTWLYSAINDIDRIESEVWKSGYYGTQYTRIDELDDRMNKLEAK